jgi:hypothetical protein
MESKEKTKICALELLDLLERGSKEYDRVYNADESFKDEIDFLSLRLKFILDENENAENYEIDYIGYGPGKFIVNMYDPYYTSCDVGYWDWDKKARKSVYEVYDDLSKVTVQVGHGYKEYEIKSKVLRK